MKEGFTVYNPCFILKTYHIHCSQIRVATRLRSIQHKPWLVKNIKRSKPIHQLQYGRVK